MNELRNQTQNDIILINFLVMFDDRELMKIRVLSMAIYQQMIFVAFTNFNRRTTANKINIAL